MVTIRSANQIILSLIDFFNMAQPDLDVKPGTVARDLFIDAPASTVSILYSELSGVSAKQSLRLVVGSDLDKLATNFGIIRKQATSATGVALYTFSSINAPININAGDTVIANNGFAYAVTAGTAVIPSATNLYSSIASKFRDQLNLAGISDTFAVQVTVLATTAGSAGNIGTYSLVRTTTSGVSNVTNVSPFTGGTDQESDVAFRNRVLSSFSGSSVGTALGYLNVALGTPGVSDAYIVQPGDPLMTRDGTITTTDVNGAITVVSEGSGGKVDVVVLGTNLIQTSDTFIYQDKSNNNDPTSSKNDFVMGQILADANKTINRKRVDDIANGVLPNQPINTLLSVTGSISGSNFASQTTDTLGRISGNYNLIKDTGAYGGSPWGFDTFHWISNKISMFSEDKIKGLFNGQDQATFTDVLDIPQIQQNISITNENSIVTFDRSVIQLLHTPATSVTRVFNVHTGERYIIVDQNPDKTGTYNTTGRIKISGSTLPSQSDQLQVDYSWIVNYDRYSDYNGLEATQNIRAVSDSVDWGYANNIRKENITFTKNGSGNFFVGTTSHPISIVNSANYFLEVDGVVSSISSGAFVNRLSVVLSNLANPSTSINSVVFKNSNVELYNTAQNNGTFINSTVVVGIELLNNVNVILPNDTVAVVGDNVSVILNSLNVFSTDLLSGSSNGSTITIPASLINTTANNIVLKVDYIANVSDLFSSATTALPSSRIGNGFLNNSNNGFNNFSPVNISRRENQIVQKNLSNKFFVELNLPSADFSLLFSQIVSVVRLSNGQELWNSSNQGAITAGTSGNYQLILSGLNTPATGDRVLVIYYATDIRRFQPFSYENDLIKTRVDTLAVDFGTGKLTIPINSFVSQASLVNFTITEPNTDIVLFNINDGYDGYLVANSNGTATLSSIGVNFSSLPDLVNKKVNIFNATNSINNGTFDIVSYNAITNNIVITNVLNKITVDQVSIIRVLDGKEIWNYSGVIDITNNKLLLPASITALSGDKVYVMFFKFLGLRRAPTKIIGTTVDQVVNTGTIVVSGTTVAQAVDIIFTATSTGLKLNIGEAIRKTLNLSSIASLPSNIKLVEVVKLEKVITASPTNDAVLEVLATYDVKNTTVQNNLLYSGNMLGNYTLQNLDFILPNTSNNTLTIGSNNLPTLGDKMRITFYYTTDNDFENLSYTRNISLYTNKKFAFVNKFYVSGGFSTSQSTKFTGTSSTQPTLGSRYKLFYDYTAPKQNERILISYNYNKLITDVTFNVESARPINADVLARQGKQVLLDLTMNVVISSSFQSSQATILQNLKNQLISALTTTKLGQIVDSVTLVNIAQGITGIERARILYFNRTGNIGQVLTVQAQNDEYFSSNNVIVNTETR